MTKSFFGLFILLAFGAFVMVSAKPIGLDKKNTSVMARPCTGAELSVRSDPNFSDAAMGGQRGASYIVKNTSRSACTINGSPGIVLLDRRGRIMGHRIKPTMGGATTIKARGQTSFEVGYHSCTFVAGATDGRNPKKCKWSAKAQIRFSGINRVFTVNDKIDADGGIEQVEAWAGK